MTTIHRNAIVPHNAQTMFDLVDDIEAYAGFLPWCEYSTVQSRNDDEVEATLGIKHGFISKSFTTKNRLQPHKMIQMKLVNGPFKHLDGFWRFESLSESSSKISLDLSFEFSTPMLSITLGPVFNHIGRTLLDAFCQRADDVYG